MRNRRIHQCFPDEEICLEELLGFSDSLLEMRVNVDALAGYNPVDIVGTGGDGKNTFNISTAACFVVAGAGYKVAEARKLYVTRSACLQRDGDARREVHQRHQHASTAHSTNATSPTFTPLRCLINAMKTVAPVRKALGVRTVFNMPGPIVNPIRPKRNVLGEVLKR